MLKDRSESPFRKITAPSVWMMARNGLLQPPGSKQVQLPVLVNISVNVGL